MSRKGNIANPAVIDDNEDDFDTRIRDNREDMLRSEARVTEARTVTWKPPTVLPEIEDRGGFHFRWVRISVHGEPDETNVNQAFREGYVPATIEDVGNIHLACDPNDRYPGGVVIGGLLLCKLPKEVQQARDAYYANLSRAQITGAENDVLRDADSRMPMLRPTFNSRTEFGSAS